ncbi:hypothetical protein F5146DRAFT_1006538 [Armillaria mellea]|nr:hypothetical protein F5146DRAFT_1006538 [Armillaria mellea]
MTVIAIYWNREYKTEESMTWGLYMGFERLGIMALGKDAGDKEKRTVESDNNKKVGTDEDSRLQSEIKLDAEDIAFKKPVAEDAGLESVMKLDAEDPYRKLDDNEHDGVGQDRRVDAKEIRLKSDNRLDDSNEETDRLSFTLLGNDSEGYRKYSESGWRDIMSSISLMVKLGWSLLAGQDFVSVVVVDTLWRLKRRAKKGIEIMLVGLSWKLWSRQSSIFESDMGMNLERDETWLPLFSEGGISFARIDSIETTADRQDYPQICLTGLTHVRISTEVNDYRIAFLWKSSNVDRSSQEGRKDASCFMSEHSMYIKREKKLAVQAIAQTQLRVRDTMEIQFI